MTKFEEFKQEFDEKFESIYDYMEDFYRESFGGKLIENNDKFNYDSYGNEDTDLERVIYFEKYDIIFLKIIKFNPVLCRLSFDLYYRALEPALIIEISNPVLCRQMIDQK